MDNELDYCDYEFGNRYKYLKFHIIDSRARIARAAIIAELTALVAPGQGRGFTPGLF